MYISGTTPNSVGCQSVHEALDEDEHDGDDAAFVQTKFVPKGNVNPDETHHSPVLAQSRGENFHCSATPTQPRSGGPSPPPSPAVQHRPSDPSNPPTTPLAVTRRPLTLNLTRRPQPVPGSICAQPPEPSVGMKPVHPATPRATPIPPKHPCLSGRVCDVDDRRLDLLVGSQHCLEDIRRCVLQTLKSPPQRRPWYSSISFCIHIAFGVVSVVPKTSLTADRFSG